MYFHFIGPKNRPINNSYDNLYNLYGAVTRPYRYKGACSTLVAVCSINYHYYYYYYYYYCHLYYYLILWGILLIYYVLQQPARQQGFKMNRQTVQPNTWKIFQGFSLNFVQLPLIYQLSPKCKVLKYLLYWLIIVSYTIRLHNKRHNRALSD